MIYKGKRADLGVEPPRKKLSSLSPYLLPHPGWRNRQCLFNLWYLGVSSPLRRLTCNDTPQVAVGSLAGAGVGWPRGPLLDVHHLVVPWPPSWSLAISLINNLKYVALSLFC